MTDNDFIELLESVRNNVIAYNDNDVFTVGDVLNLINRLQVRVKKYDKVEYFADKIIESFRRENEKQKAEIERLKDEKWVLEEQLERAEQLNDSLGDDIDNKLKVIYKLHEQLKTAKSEAIKEFAERLKERYDINNWDLPYGCSFDVIDNLVKEMEKENQNEIM